MVQVQGSAYNDVGPIRFRINYGIRHDRLTQVMSGRPPRPRAFEINFGDIVAGSARDDWWMLQRVAHSRRTRRTSSARS